MDYLKVIIIIFTISSISLLIGCEQSEVPELKLNQLAEGFMGMEVQAPRIRSVESPRKLISKHFSEDLPISGGWGYTKEDAVVIDRNDPTIPKNMPFNGVGFEYNFVAKRTYEELIIFRPENDSYSGIERNFLEQNTITDGEKKYDVLFFQVTAFPTSDWEELKAEWEENNGFQSSQSELDAHNEKRTNRMVYYIAEYWFDITSFYGKY